MDNNNHDKLSFSSSSSSTTTVDEKKFTIPPQRRKKAMQILNTIPLVPSADIEIHPGHSCDRCGLVATISGEFTESETFVGGRFHCEQCEFTDSEDFDLCGKCVDMRLDKNIHPSTHINSFKRVAAPPPPPPAAATASSTSSASVESPKKEEEPDHVKWFRKQSIEKLREYSEPAEDDAKHVAEMIRRFALASSALIAKLKKDGKWIEDCSGWIQQYRDSNRERRKNEPKISWRANRNKILRKQEARQVRVLFELELESLDIQLLRIEAESRRYLKDELLPVLDDKSSENGEKADSMIQYYHKFSVQETETLMKKITKYQTMIELIDLSLPYLMDSASPSSTEKEKETITGDNDEDDEDDEYNEDDNDPNDKNKPQSDRFVAARDELPVQELPDDAAAILSALNDERLHSRQLETRMTVVINKYGGYDSDVEKDFTAYDKELDETEEFEATTGLEYRNIGNFSYAKAIAFARAVESAEKEKRVSSRAKKGLPPSRADAKDPSYNTATTCPTTRKRDARALISLTSSIKATESSSSSSSSTTTPPAKRLKRSDDAAAVSTETSKTTLVGDVSSTNADDGLSRVKQQQQPTPIIVIDDEDL